MKKYWKHVVRSEPPWSLSDYQKRSCVRTDCCCMSDWWIIKAGMGAKWTYKHGLIEEKNRCDEKVSGNSYWVLIINYELDVDIFWRKCQPCLLVLNLPPAYGAYIQVKQPIYTSMILWCRDGVAGWLMLFWVCYRCPKSKRALPFSKSLGLLCN